MVWDLGFGVRDYGLRLGFRALGFDTHTRTIGRQGQRVNWPRSQRAQYPLIKEYSLNHNMKPYII